MIQKRYWDRVTAENVVNEAIQHHLKTNKVMICGSIRRNKSQIRDVDIVVQQDYWPVFSEWIKNNIDRRNVERTLKDGTIKVFYLPIDDWYLPVEVYVAPEGSWGASIFYATGSGKFNMIMRTIAKKNGYLLNQYGLFDRNNNMVAGETEEGILNKLGVGWRDPDERDK